MDYHCYKPTAIDIGRTFLFSVGITVAIAFLFYNHIWGIIVFPPVFGLLYRNIKEEGKKQRQETLKTEFMDAARAISTSLLAGISLENAWKEAEKEIRILYGPHSIMCRELQEMNRSVSVSVPLEQLLEQFAERSGVEDIVSFSEVFSFAKRSGGNFVGMLERAVRHMRQKRDIQAEIEVMVAAKRMEQKIMNVIPVGMLVYLRLASGDYLEVLYGNAMGVLFMSGCLAVYMAAILLSKRIMNIEV